jgi:hypothetical protein
MTSRPLQNRTPVYAAILFILMSNLIHLEAIFARESKQDQGQVRVHDFKVYREVAQSNRRLIMEKKAAKGKRVISFFKGESRLTLVLSGKLRKIHFSKSLGNRNYHLYAKIENSRIIKLGLIPEYKLVQFDSSCERQEREIKSLLARLSIPELTEKMSAISVGNLIDSTCRLSEKSKDKFADYISDSLNPQTSFLSKCLNSETARSEIINDEKLRTSAAEIFGAYLVNTEDIANGKGKLKFSCIEIQDVKNAPSAVFDPNTNSIRLPIRDGKLVENECESLERIIAHELCHPAAKDAVVHDLDRICLKSVDPDKQTNQNCETVAAPEKDHNMNLAAVEEANKAIDKAQLAKVQPELQKTVKAEDFKPLDKITDTAIEQVANPSSPQSFQANTQQVFEGMDSTFDSLSESLTSAVTRSSNMAIGAAVPIASAAAAASTSGSKRSIASTSSLPSNIPSTEQEYKVEEILADQYQVPVNQVETILKKSADAQPTSAAKKSATAAKKSTNDDSSPAAAVSAKAKASNNSAGLDLNSDGASTSSSPAASTNSTSAPSPARKPSSISNNNEVATVAIQELEQFSEVRGNRYSEIRKLYQDPQFKQELANRGITIKVGSKYFGKAPTTSSVIFVDTGSTLKKVAGVK